MGRRIWLLIVGSLVAAFVGGCVTDGGAEAQQRGAAMRQIQSEYVQVASEWAVAHDDGVSSADVIAAAAVRNFSEYADRCCNAMNFRTQSGWQFAHNDIMKTVYAEVVGIILEKRVEQKQAGAVPDRGQFSKPMTAPPITSPTN